MRERDNSSFMFAILETISSNVGLILLALGVIIAALLVWIVRLEIRIRRLTEGKNGKSLETSILSIKQGHESMERFRKEMESYLQNVEGRLARSVREVRTVRFNPFKESGTGGNQSFATAFINEKGDGVILSSLYSRDRVSMFAKPVIDYSSDHELTEEERSVLEETRQSLMRRHEA